MKTNQPQARFKVAMFAGKQVQIRLTADGDECLGHLKISRKKCLEKAGGDETVAALIYEAARSDGLPGYRVPLDLLED